MPPHALLTTPFIGKLYPNNASAIQKLQGLLAIGSDIQTVTWANKMVRDCNSVRKQFKWR
ncbi:hypothetical protein PG997_008187 [Apiospora hydei]|uniref:Uncharacterized protein n=1 Tax=Apiospora hydei TaxID=1337664 RepID=A0ABR1WA38_9PEZI